MRVFGADFSGAKTPNIYYVEGELDSHALTVIRSTPCDDRLDLFMAIVESGAPWGLDFPFALTVEAYHWLGLAGWSDLLERVVDMRRDQFMAFLQTRLGRFEAKCAEPSEFCRHTDVEVNAHSPLKQFNPNMRAMIYGGLKLLAHLRKAGVRVYPFHAFDGDAARVYEVYPSAAWDTVGLRRGTDMKLYVNQFNQLGAVPLQVKLAPELEEADNQDVADSIVACVTLASALHNLEPDWKTCPARITTAEWQRRYDEGLIVRF